MTASFLKGKEALLKWLANNGFAVCVACCLFWMIGSTARWIASELIVPARDRFSQHLDTVERLGTEKLDAIKTAIVEQERAIRAIERQQERHQETTERVAAATSKAADTLESVNSVLRDIRDAKHAPMTGKAVDASKHSVGVTNSPGG